MVKKTKVMLTVKLIYLCNINVQTRHANSNYAHLQIMGVHVHEFGKIGESYHLYLPNKDAYRYIKDIS